MNPERKISLLIAEDDPHIRFLMETAAEFSGCFEPIRSVEDGQAALAVIRALSTAEQPEFVATDLCMPRMTGLELVRALKGHEATRHIPIAIITSSDFPHDRENALAAGVCAFEAKPVGLEALTRMLTRLRRECCEVAVAR